MTLPETVIGGCIGAAFGTALQLVVGLLILGVDRVRRRRQPGEGRRSET